MSHLAGFLALATVLIVTPGPDTALTIRNTLLGGRRSGVLTAAGVAGGQATWTVATAFGLAALLAASEPLFAAVRLVGAVYLVLLGVMTLRGRREQERTEPGSAEQASRLPPATALRQGFVSNLANPKMAAFFPALLPQFAPGSGAAFIVLLGLGLLFALMTLVWLIGYAMAVAKAGGFLRRPRIRRAVEAVTGAVLIALGLRLATTHRS